MRWGVAGNIVVAWLLTFPAAAAIGALTYGITQIFGDGAVGPVLIVIAGIALTAFAFARRIRQGLRCRRMSGVIMLATIVDSQALLETAVAALAAGVGVALTFSLAILGTARYAEASREHRRARRRAFGCSA